MVKFLLIGGTEFFGRKLTCELCKCSSNMVYSTYFEKDIIEYLNFLDRNNLSSQVCPIEINSNKYEQINKTILDINPDVICILPIYKCGIKKNTIKTTTNVIKSLNVNKCLDVKCVYFCSTLQNKDSCDKDISDVRQSEILLLDNVKVLPSINFVICRLANLIDGPNGFIYKLYKECIKGNNIYLSEINSTVYGMLSSEAVKLTVNSIIYGKSGDSFVKNYYKYNINDMNLLFLRFYDSNIKDFIEFNIPDLCILYDNELKFSHKKNDFIVCNTFSCESEPLVVNGIFLCYCKLNELLTKNKILCNDTCFDNL